jgi:Tol biopolymer transport system component
VKLLLPVRGEYHRSWRRPVRVVMFACLGVLLSCPAANSAGSGGESFNAGIVWGGAAGIYGANVDGSSIRRLVPSIADEHSDPAWSPSGEALVFSARISDSVDLRILRPAAGTLRLLKLRSRWTSPRRARDVSYVLESTWAPDEQHLAVSDAWNLLNSTIRVVSLHTGQMRPLTKPNDRLADSAPAWSPDGRTIAFVRQRVSERAGSGVPVIFLIGRDGRGFHKFTRGSSPSWSPDGRHIVFAWGDSVYRIQADGRGRTRIARGLKAPQLADPAVPSAGLHPRWSPDGRKILYTTNLPSGSNDLWVMSVAGGDRVRILRHRDISGAGWQPG